MSKLKVNELDSKTGTTVTVTTGKTLDIPAGATVSVAGTANLTNSTLTLPATLPATAGTNITAIPGANITGTIPLAALGNAPATDTSNIESDIALLGFRIAANGSLSKYNLVDQTEDAFTDQTGIDASTSVDEVYNVAGKYYTGQIANPVGGTETTYSDGGTDYVIRSFLSGTTNFVVEKAGTVDYLLVAGGGGGSTGGIGGGGGGGGFLTATGSPLAIGSHPVVIGAGGEPWLSAAATSGGDTTFNSLTAVGGGGGVGYGGSAGPTGGSGGGGNGYGGAGGASTPGQGNNGGPGAPGGGSHGGGGGGGAGAVGATAVTPSGGAGGVGLSNSLRTNSGVFYAGGGGGLKWTGSQGGGGNGGGGAAQDTNGTAGTANTGGGGGGGGSAGGLGGSGIAVIRYVAGAFGPTYNQLTLVSNATTAVTTPTKGDIVMTYTNGAGTATLNTDLTAEFSADDGSTWTSTTLVAQGNTGTSTPHLIAAAHDVTLTSTSGTAMRYRIKTLNQAVGKETRIQAVSLGWS